MMKMTWCSLLLVLSLSSKAYSNPVVGRIVFGNKGSSLVVSDDSFLHIVPTGGVTLAGGNLTNAGNGVVSGHPINFDFGSYTLFNAQIDLQGVLVPDATTGGTVQIGGNAPQGYGVMISNPGGLEGIEVMGAEGLNGSILRGQPLFFGSDDLSLQNSNSIMQIAVQNAINTNINLNGGILRLQDDLLLGDSAVIKGDGICLLNGRRLSLGGKAKEWSGNIIWLSALDIQFDSAVSLVGTWSFFDESQINGNGNVLDLSGGGEIIVADDATLSLASVQITGLGNGEGFGKIRLGNNATLFLSDVVIEMGDDYDVLSGTWYVQGSSKVITKDHILTFKDSPDKTTNGHLTVNRVDLTYDTLATLDQNNIQPMLINDPERKYVTIIGSGDIRTIKQDSVTFHNYRSDALLQKYAIVAPYRKFIVYPDLNDDQTQNFDVLIDGNSNFLGFTLTDEPVFIVSPGVHATTQNMIMRDISPNHLSLGTGSSLTFGNKTMLTLARNEVLTYPWVFKGDTILRGTGMVLTLEGDGALILEGENSSLLLDGVIIKGISGNNIRCTHDSSTLKLRGVKWIQSEDFAFSTGALELVDDVTMVGPKKFTYASQQPFAILSDATLFLTRELTFNWEGSSTGLTLADDGTAAIQVDQIVMQALNGLVINSPGRLVVRNDSRKIGAITHPNMFLDYSGSFE